MDDLISLRGISIGKNIFSIGDKTIFLNSCEIHYFRIEPEEWKNRIAKVKEMGFNAVSIPVPWNFHEKNPDEFDFSSANKDLDFFLHLCENKSLYILLKIGPWIDADVLNGGIPQALIDNHPKIMCLNDKNELSKWKSKSAPPISYLSPTYLKYVERYIKRISPILSKHLFPHGGLILIQPDNKTSFGNNRGIYEVGYNSVHIEYYQKFLQKKYKEISSLNTSYGQNYLDFEYIRPPTNESFSTATLSYNKFTMNGEIISILDWMECKEWVIQDYIGQLCLFLRLNRLHVPYFATISGNESPSDSNKLTKAYKINLFVGEEWKFSNFDFDFWGDLKIEINSEIIKAKTPKIPPFVSEFNCNHVNNIKTTNQTQINLRLAIGHGIKAINRIIAVSGISLKDNSIKREKISNISAVKGIKYNNNLLETDIGVSYDLNVFAGQNSQNNPDYNVMKLFSDYLALNGPLLVSSRKICDKIAIMHYHPYSRIKFDLKKLGGKIDYRKYIGNNSESINLLRVLNQIGIKPTVIDPEITPIEKMLENKIIIASLFNFMDSESMKKIKNFVEKGGTLISLLDIPQKNEFFLKDTTLSEIFGASINSEETDKEFVFMSEKFESFESLYSFVPADKKSIKEKDIIAYKEQNKKKKIYGFHRKIGKGNIYHLGFFIKPERNGKGFLRKFLNLLNFSEQNTEISHELSIIRQKAENGEEFITVANLLNEDLEKISIKFHNFEEKKKDKNEISIEDLSIPSRSAIQWSKNKSITDFLNIIICTSEINKIQKILRVQPSECNIKGFHFKKSKNFMQLEFSKKPENVVLGDKKISEKKLKEENGLGIKLVDKIIGKGLKKYYLNLWYSGNLKLKLSFGDKKKILESVFFEFIEIENFSKK